MVKSNYTFKMDYADLAMMVANLKALQARAVITPHDRKEGKSLELLLCGILRKLAQRLDAKLFDFVSEVKFKMNAQEALAFHCAYKYGWLPTELSCQPIFESIDRVI